MDCHASMAWRYMRRQHGTSFSFIAGQSHS
jgi:hypothetical protein